MSPDITCIKNGTIIMALHEFEYLPRSIRGKSSEKVFVGRYCCTSLGLLCWYFGHQQEEISCNTLQLSVNWVGKYLGIDIIGVCLSR
jgi:hypothetical protein